MDGRPNIIIYLSDQQRADTLGCYGQKLPVSPVLDALAASGTLFERAYTCQPVCGPARACIQTGKYQNKTGCFVNNIGLRDGEDTVAKRLGSAGYDTAYFGKWHLASDFKKGALMSGKPVPKNRMGGYDHFVVSEALEMTSHGYGGYMFDTDGARTDFAGYRTDCVTDCAIDYLHGRDQGKPLFMFISHIEPHHQNDRDAYEGPDGSKERFAGYETPEDLLYGEYEGDWRENYPDYLGCCRKLDDNLGKLIDHLKALGEFENTVIIFTSDHGCHFQTREGEYKRGCFESCLRIPMVIAGGPFNGGRRVEKPVSLISLASTVLRLAGGDIPDDMVYPPLQNALDDNLAWYDAAFFQISETELARGIRTRRYTYCVHAPHVQPLSRFDWKNGTVMEYRRMLADAKCGSDSYIEQYLFDNEEDPFQKRNLVSDASRARVRQALSARLIACMREAGEDAPVIYPAGTKLS